MCFLGPIFPSVSLGHESPGGVRVNGSPTEQASGEWGAASLMDGGVVSSCLSKTFQTAGRGRMSGYIEGMRGKRGNSFFIDGLHPLFLKNFFSKSLSCPGAVRRSDTETPVVSTPSRPPLIEPHTPNSPSLRLPRLPRENASASKSVGEESRAMTMVFELGTLGGCSEGSPPQH